MATEAQTKANYENAQASTGPQTPEGKLHSSRNSLKFGLFSTKNCVLPEETEEYENLARALWDSLRPLGPVEEMFAVEIVRNAWRLRRCAAAEAALNDAPDSAVTQAAVDRARTQATGVLQRTMAELRRLQTERWTRYEVLPPKINVSRYGIADSNRVIEALTISTNCTLVMGNLKGRQNFWKAIRATTPNTKRTQSPNEKPAPIARDAPEILRTAA